MTNCLVTKDVSSYSAADMNKKSSAWGRLHWSDSVMLIFIESIGELIPQL